MGRDITYLYPYGDSDLELEREVRAGDINWESLVYQS